LPYGKYIDVNKKRMIMLKLRIVLSQILIAAVVTMATAGEGMWLPIFLKSLNEAEMQGMGMKLSAEDIYSVNKGWCRKTQPRPIHHFYRSDR